MDSNPFLSIIIPAYNEANRLPKSLKEVAEFLRQQDYAAEVLVVENGSHDQTFAVASEFANRFFSPPEIGHPKIRVLQERLPGKGRAIRRGMLEAIGTYRFMADADLSMPIAEIPRFLPPRLDSFEIAIASREAPGAVRINEPQFRHIGGRTINLIIRSLALPRTNDTQCGFKCFHHSVADDLFSRQTMTGWSFDIEILFIARMRGYRVIELPIPWYYRKESKVSPFSDAIRMTRDIFIIRKNARAGVYDR